MEDGTRAGVLKSESEIRYVRIFRPEQHAVSKKSVYHKPVVPERIYGGSARVLKSTCSVTGA